METDELIRRLSEDCAPVRPFTHPVWRASLWFMLSLVYVAMVVLAMGLRPDIAARLRDWRFVLELAAALLTSMMAAAAALCAGCPGRPWWERLAPLPFLAFWLGLLGEGCWRDYLAAGARGLAIRQDAMCLPVIAMTSVVPAVAIFVLIRRGAPLAPFAITGCAALAAAALSAAALRLFHDQDSSVTVLVWQFGSVALLTGLEAMFGRSVIRWRNREETLAAIERAAR
ncbi:MAG TPA: DUF1109 domain-containing protein [Methylocystis sp.]|nr:DUF1109 domain-containing protein [Methylocystis sp.]